MASRRMTVALLLSCTTLIAVVLGFTGVIHIQSFQKNQTAAIMASQAVASRESVDQIEYALHYGKELTRFYGITGLLQRAAQTAHVEEVRLVLADGSYVANQWGDLAGALPAAIARETSFSGNPVGHAFHRDQDHYWLFVPIRDRSGAWVGSLALLSPRAAVDGLTLSYRRELFHSLLLLALAATVGLSLVVLWLVRRRRSQGDLTTRFVHAAIVTLGVTQILFGVQNYLLFREAYLSMARQGATIAAEAIGQSVEGVVARGVPYSSLYQLDEYLARMTESLPALGRIQVISADGVALADTDPGAGESPAGDDAEWSHLRPLRADSTGQPAHLAVILSRSYQQGQLREIILDSLTVLVTGLVFLVEMIFLLRLLLHGGIGAAVMEGAPSDREGLIIRPLAFFVFSAMTFSSTFVPVAAQGFAPVGWLSKGGVGAAAVSIEMLLSAVFSLIAGKLTAEHGGRRVFFMGAATMAAGAVLSGLAKSSLLFLLGRAVTGASVGLLMISLQAIATARRPGEDAGSSGLVALTAGDGAGLVCGVVVGALLADRIGFAGVFFATLAPLFLAVLLAAISRGQIGGGRAPAPDSPVASIPLIRFLTHPQVLRVFLLVVMPTASALMFLDYFFPVFAQGMGLSTAAVGRWFLVQGLCQVYLGPVLTGLLERRFRPRGSLLLAGLLMVAALVGFGMGGSLIAAYGAVLLLSSADSFGATAASQYFRQLGPVLEYGLDQAEGWYRNVRKIGSMIGPVLFSSLSILGSAGVGVIGVALLTALLLFAVVSRQRRGDAPVAD